MRRIFFKVQYDIILTEILIIGKNVESQRDGPLRVPTLYQAGDRYQGSVPRSGPVPGGGQKKRMAHRAIP